MSLVSPGEISVSSVSQYKVLIICPQKRLLVQDKGHCEKLDEKPPESAPYIRVS